jgi:hypothetical protein
MILRTRARRFADSASRFVKDGGRWRGYLALGVVWHRNDEQYKKRNEHHVPGGSP